MTTDEVMAPVRTTPHRIWNMRPLLETPESHIHTSKNQVKDAMNSALIAIGLRNGHLRARAIAAARRIGPIGVDHGATNCKSPDAVKYITKAGAHAVARRGKAAATKRAR